MHNRLTTCSRLLGVDQMRIETVVFELTSLMLPVHPLLHTHGPESLLS